MRSRITTLLPLLILVPAGCGDNERSAAATMPDSAPALAAADTSASESAPANATATGSTVNKPRSMAPPMLRGIYLNAYAAGSARRLPVLLAMADSTEINAFVVDVKDEKGMRYRSALPLAQQIGGEITMRNLKAVVDSMHAHGVWAIARIVVFKDPLLSQLKPDWSIKAPDGALWRDKEGNTWVSAWDPNVWEFNIQIAEEVLKAGFDEVQFDYVRFPEPFPSLPEQIHPNARGDRTEAIRRFLAKASPRVHALGGVLAADVFGLSPNDPRDVNIGQQWERIISVVDHVLPMVYPSHYLPTHLKGVPTPNKMPYETVFMSLGMGVVRAQRLRQDGGVPARIIPWLQAFSAPWVNRDFPYGAQQAADQIRAVYDVGLEDWIFWHPGSRYEHIASAFAKDATLQGKPYNPSEAMIAQVDLIDRMGARAQREKVVD